MEVTFLGQVLPARLSLNVETPPTRVAVPSFNLTLELSKLVVKNSYATITATVVEGDGNILLIRNLVAEQTRSALDFIGYSQGLHFDLDIISAIIDGKQKIDFELGIPVLKHAHQAESDRGEVEEKRLQTAVFNTAARLALSDFRKAMTDPPGTGFYCYRAIEALKHGVESGDQETNWQTLRETLNVDRSAIDFVKAHADLRRHGRPSGVTDAQRAKIFLITDKILGRYLEYLARENVCLPIGDFPLVKDTDFGPER